MKKMFPRHARKIVINTTNMILDIVQNCTNKLYRNLYVVSDRVREFETILNKYNDIKVKTRYYNFDNINVVSL